MIPREDVELHPFRPTEAITVRRQTGVDGEGYPVFEIRPGFHFNLRVRGALEESLRNAGSENDENYWNRLKLKTYIDTRLGVAGSLVNKEVTGTKLPGGYEWAIGPNKVRLYDAALIADRVNVWQ